MSYLIKSISKSDINTIYEFRHTHTHTHTHIYIYIYTNLVLKFERDSKYNSYKIFHYRILELSAKEKCYTELNITAINFLENLFSKVLMYF